MGDWTHNLLDLNEKGAGNKKGNTMGLMGIELGSPKSKEKVNIMFKIILSVFQGIRNRFPLPNPVLTHKSYVSKFLMNAAPKIKINILAYLQDAQMLYHIILGKHESLRQTINEASWLVCVESSI